METTRRTFLVLTGLAPTLVAASRAGAAEPAQCPDPAALPLSQKSRRRSLGYMESAPDPKKRCGLCAFFSSGASGDTCGTCQLLGGGQVSAAAVCNSFAPKPG